MSEDPRAEDECYVVAEGDCISSLADARGLNWQTLWKHNRDLRALRKNPNALQPGDEVLIPAKRPRIEECPTDQLHKFVLNGVPAKFRLILERFDEPLANKPYTLAVDGQVHNGTTDSEGLLEISLTPGAISGHLVLPEEDLEYDLSFGELDPSDTNSGAQARLANLGFHQGGISGVFDDDTRDAILMFQTTHRLPATGELDDHTVLELEQRHDKLHSQPPPESNPPPPETVGEDDHLEEIVYDHDEDNRRFQELANMDEEG